MALLLKYTKTSQKVHFSVSEVLHATFNTSMIHIQRQLVTEKTASLLFFSILQEKEG